MWPLGHVEWSLINSPWCANCPINRSREAKIVEASVIASYRAQVVRIGVLVGTAKLIAPQRVAVDTADFGNPSDRDPVRIAAARQVASLIEDGSDPLLL